MFKPYSLDNKSLGDKKRQLLIKATIGEIKAIVFPTASSQEEVLNKAVTLLTGEVLPIPAVVTADSLKAKSEVKKEREQRRRNRLKAAYEALEKWILEKKLVVPNENQSLEQLQILKITLNYLRQNDETPVDQSAAITVEEPVSPLKGIIDFLMNDIENIRSNVEKLKAVIAEIVNQDGKELEDKKE